ncbi:MAG: flagellar basal body-associated FliL family protein [Alphaproteobacteria bacterium]
MSDETADQENEEIEDTEGEDAEGLEGSDSGRKFSGRKIVLIAAPVLLLLLGGAGAYFGGFLSSGEDEALAAAEAEGKPDSVVFYDLPDLLVNLSSRSRKPIFLKMSISLELGGDADAARVGKVLPRVIDNFQTYLRELRAEDLQGSAGIYRLREDLLVRVNIAAKPARIRDVLFREILVQ